MCTVLCIGDLHFKDSNAALMDSLEERLHTHLVPKPDFIVLLGDTLDRYNDVKTTTLCRATRFIARLLTVADVYLLIGNHDRRNNDVFLTEEHPFLGHKSIPRLTVVDKPVMRSINAHNFLFVPYVHAGRFAEAIPDCRGCTAIFAHQEFRGSVSKDEGDEWPLDYPLVISGHIHEYSHLQTNVIYTGSPLQHTPIESPDKSISRFVFPSPNLALPALPASSYKEERIYLELPVCLTVDLKPEEIEAFVPPRNISDLRLMIHCSSSEKKAIVTMSKIRLWESLGIKVRYRVRDEHCLTMQPARDYRKSLAAKVLSDPKLRELYQELIGPLPAARVVINPKRR